MNNLTRLVIGLVSLGGAIASGYVALMGLKAQSGGAAGPGIFFVLLVGVGCLTVFAFCLAGRDRAKTDAQQQRKDLHE